MTAEDVTLYDIAGGHRPPLQFKLTHYQLSVDYGFDSSGQELEGDCEPVSYNPLT